MQQKIYPEKLKSGDEIRVIAPSRSMNILSKQNRQIATERLLGIGLKVTFGKNVEEADDFASSGIESRIEDLHDAFRNPNVKGILTVIGGFNSNQLLGYINWELIKNNPKVFCGYSDITVLNNAIFAKTGLVNYSGLHYSSFGEKQYFNYSLEHFKKCCMSDKPFKIISSLTYSDDAWHKDQDNRKIIKNDGCFVINEGKAEGTILGGNLCTLNLLQGTKCLPDISNSILFVEDDAHADGTDVAEFDRSLQSLMHQTGFNTVKALIIGRFQPSAKMTKELLIKIVKAKKELDNIPVIANLDFGHTTPMFTFPIGGECIIDTEKLLVEITKH